MGRGSVAPRGGASSTTDKKKKRGFFRRYWWMFVLVPALAIAGVVGTVMYVYANTDIPDAPPGPQTTIVYDRGGKVIARLHAGENRVVIPFDQIPDSLKHAVLSAEDKDFYNHGGVSPWSIIRAGWADLTNGSFEQGGSTITQQYVKIVYTGSERTLARKAHEAILAVKLDHTYSKDEILEKYLNTVYFGNGAYGAEAAARTYFGIPARRLDVLQAATIAATIKAPAVFDPVRNPARVKEQRNYILDRMVADGYLDQAEADRLQAEPVTVVPGAPQIGKYAYFVSHVSSVLQQRYGYQETFAGGLRVRTSLDQRLQRAAERAVRDALPSPQDPSAALVAIDPATGDILAMVGGRNFEKAQFNLATQAHRQAGSAFKPFTFLGAMEERIDPKSVWNGPAEIEITDPRCETNGQPWVVHNAGDSSEGRMSLLDATAHSVNTIYAQVITAVDPERVVEVADRAGIQSPLQPVCAITLGTEDVTPLDMATAYATLAARGDRHWPQSITRVRTAEGRTLEVPANPGEQVFDANDVDLTTYALQGVVTKGTGTAAALADRPVAGKTGTAQDNRDAWFCGYTPQLATCVWMGYTAERKPMENVEGVPAVYGGTIPAAIWHQFMAEATGGEPVETFPTPSFAGYDVLPEAAATPSPTPSPSPSATPSPTPSPTPTPTPTPSPSPTPTPSPSGSPTPSAPPTTGAGMIAAGAVLERRRRVMRGRGCWAESGSGSGPRSGSSSRRVENAASDSSTTGG
jgi:penicillin-binding protein 1A